MWIEQENIYARVVHATVEEHAWLGEQLSFDNPKAQFVNRAGGRMPDKFQLFEVFKSRFPAGLLGIVRDAAASAGIVIELGDKRPVVCEPDPAADLAWLRDYQLEAVEKVVEHERGILHMVTGAGKTEVAVGLTRRLPCLWLFVVHRNNLVEQAAERYERRTLLPAGRIMEGAWNMPKEGTVFVCASLQSLYAGLKKGDKRTNALLAMAEGLIVDECHTLPAESFKSVVNATAGARYRVGLSGTPLARGDRRSVEAIGALGPVIYRVRPETLIDAGVLAKPTIKMLRCTHEVSSAATHQGWYGESIVRNAARNRLLVEATTRAEKPCLVFVREIKHGKLLEKALERAGEQVGFTWGSHSVEMRTRAVRDLTTTSRTNVLICSVIFQEGQDIPELRSVVIAGGGKSVIAALQRIGRGMRVSAGKDGVTVYDVHDEGCGLPDCSHRSCRWHKAHTRERLAAYSSEGHTVHVEQLV